MFQFLCNHVEIVVDGLCQYLGIALRLGDVGVSEHSAYIFDLGPIAEHIGGEGMTGQMRVQPRLDASHHLEGFQLSVVFLIAHLRKHHAIFL